MRKKTFLFFLIILFLFGCNQTSNNEPEIPDNKEEEMPLPACLICRELPCAKNEIIDELPKHTPTTFDESSITSSIKNIANGVIQTKWTFSKNNGYTAMVVTTEVDLNKASIAAGTFENTTTALSKTTIYNQAIYYEMYNHNRQVVAGVNGDFFGGNTPVNAFVKDSTIIKDSHNDKGIYDYTNTSADLPASMPMLFGISGSTAQIAPIIRNATVKDTVQSKLFYTLNLLRDNTFTSLSNQIVLNKSDKNNINIVFNTQVSAIARENYKVIKLNKHVQDSTRIHGEIVEITTAEKYTAYQPTNETFYIIIPDTIEISELKIGDILSYYINSSDNTWKYYDTIIGCRQSLIENGDIALTLKNENSNGAKTTGIPRTAVGILPNGNVVLFSVEGLRYGGKSKLDSDPYGLNLLELADFMKYIGIYNAANLDGGGSTQLITKNIENEEFEVVVRSSDYGTYDLNSSRSVINSILVTIPRE